MTIDVAAELGRQALFIAMVVAMPAMVTGMLAGLVISLIQSITSIQEQTLSIVPKILITLLVTVAVLPWIAGRLVDYTIELYLGIPTRF